MKLILKIFNRLFVKDKLLMVLFMFLIVLLFKMKFLLLKIGGFVIITLLPVLIMFSIIVIFQLFFIAKEVVDEWNTKKNIKSIISLIFVFFLLASIMIPYFRTDENFLQSKVQIKGIRKSTMNLSIILFRENGSFENVNIGWYGYVKYLKGNWKEIGDTIIIIEQKDTPVLLVPKNLIKHKSVYKIENDTLYPTYYKIIHR
jgi:hypothetical protein